jgi:hypothetical protein
MAAGTVGPEDVAVIVEAGREFTAMVAVLVRVPFEGNVPAAGLNVHASPAGRLGQLKKNWSEYPFNEVSETFRVVELPTAIVAEVLDTEMVAFSMLS